MADIKPYAPEVPPMTKRVLLINPDGTAEVNGVKVRVVPVGPQPEWSISMGEIYRRMLSAAAIDLSSLPVVPERLPIKQDDPLFIASANATWNAALDAIGAAK